MDMVPREPTYGPGSRVAIPETRFLLEPSFPGLLTPVAQVTRRVERGMRDTVAMATVTRCFLPRETKSALRPSEVVHVETASGAPTAHPGAPKDTRARSVGGPLVARHRVLKVTASGAHLGSDSEVAGQTFPETAVPPLVGVSTVAPSSTRASTTTGGRPARRKTGARHVSL